MKYSLKKLLTMEDLLEATVDHMNFLQQNDDALYNFVQGSLWKKQLQNFNEDGIALPLFVYHDDVETRNALGSHSGTNQIGAVYATIPCFPASFSLKLNNIIATDIFYTEDRKLYGNKVIFKTLIEES